MLDTETGGVVNRTLKHEGKEVREFYSQLPHPVLVGIEAIGPMQWFLQLLDELGIGLSLPNRIRESDWQRVKLPTSLALATRPRRSWG
jgi:hypothetical protein